MGTAGEDSGGTRRGAVGWLCLLWALGWPMAATAQQAWSVAATSPGLQSVGPRTEVRLAPPPGQVPADAVARRVMVTLDAGAAHGVEVQLCGGRVPVQCQAVSAVGSLDTRVFDGVPATGPFWLSFRVPGPRPLTQPRYVRSRFIVWFDAPATRH